MPTNLYRVVFAMFLLVFGAGAEEILPRVLNVGFPILLAAVQIAALRNPRASVVVFALAAGAFEDALGSLPIAASSSYFLLIALLVHHIGFPRSIAVVTYPCYHIWLSVWTGGVGGEIWGRLLVSVPIGLLTVCAVGFVLTWAERGFALDEES